MVRRYNTDGRAQQTAALRGRILDAAAARFVEKGYLATTIGEVAADAGVSAQTVYNVIGGKNVLLKTVYDRAVVGDDEPVAMSARPEIAAMLAATDPRLALRHYASLSRAVSHRVLPLLTVVLAQASSGDPTLTAFRDTIEQQRVVGAARTAHHLASRFGLRAGLDQTQAADILWALTAPELAHRLVNTRQWGWPKFEQWLTDTMTDSLIGPPPPDHHPESKPTRTRPPRK